MNADGSRPGRALRIGLSGPIGCGKSTIARWLAARGAVVVDADLVARDVTAPGGPALEAVIARFGERFRLADGTLDRRALGRAVFADAPALADLEAILHPAVRLRIRDAFANADERGAAALVVEAIKLVEGGLDRECDEVWLVTCDPAAQRARLRERNMTAGEVNQRIRVQEGLRERLAPAATRLIDTSGTPEETEIAVDRAFRDALATHAARGVAGVGPGTG